MATCRFKGNAEMYGLGIRIGFYLHWHGIILASWIVPREVSSMRLINFLIVISTFLALLIQVDGDNLKPVEVYIVLLLTFGGYLPMVPLYVCRALTCCIARLDLTRCPRVAPGPIFSVLNFLLLISVSVFQLWFWFANSRSAKTNILGCMDYGFFFGRISLDQKGFVVANILLQFSILIACLWVFIVTCVKISRKSWLIDLDGDQESIRSEDDISEVRRTALQEINSLISLLVASTVIAAVELSIQWNEIDNVNEVTSASQTIPMIINLGLLTRVVYIALFTDIDDRYRIRTGSPTQLWTINTWRFGRRSTSDSASSRSSRHNESRG